MSCLSPTNILLKVGLLSSSLELAILRLLFWSITWGLEVGSCLGCRRKERVILEERLKLGARAGVGPSLLHLRKHSWLSSPWQREGGRN